MNREKSTTMPGMQTRQLAQDIRKLGRTFLPEVVGLVCTALIWSYNHHRSKVLQMKSFSWFCRGCGAQITLKPTPEAASYLEGGNRIVLDCDCSRRYLISKSKVIDYNEWLLVRYFRELLNHDIIDEIEWEEAHHDER